MCTIRKLVWAPIDANRKITMAISRKKISIYEQKEFYENE